jgi:flagellar transcriptional activator FlhD
VTRKSCECAATQPAVPQKSDRSRIECHRWETNLQYLLLAQQLIRTNRAEAMLRLGIGTAVADILLSLIASQLMALANANTLLCGFRLNDHVILRALTENASEIARAHAVILLTQQPAESIGLTDRRMLNYQVIGKRSPT